MGEKLRINGYQMAARHMATIDNDNVVYISKDLEFFSP
jgi:hypothetical protein